MSKVIRYTHTKLKPYKHYTNTMSMPYFVGMFNSRWTELSQKMLTLQFKLIQYGFYGTPERLRDVIDPLVNALDRRNVPVKRDHEDAANLKVKKKPMPVAKSLDSAQVAVTATDNELDETLPEDSLLREEEEDPERWQVKWLEIMESVAFLLLIMMLVLLAVILVLYVTFADADDNPGSTLYAVGICILVCFVLEISARFYLFQNVKKDVTSFFLNPYTWIDIAVIIIDVVYLCLPISKDRSSGYSKTIRLIRLLRLLRY